jgi:hypothetical protein
MFSLYIYISTLNNKEKIINTFDAILQKLKDNFPGGNVTLENTSSQHIGHNALLPDLGNRKCLHSVQNIQSLNSSLPDCNHTVQRQVINKLLII